MFARTPRLTLRPAWIEDAPALATAIAYESVTMRLARLPWPYALADAERFVAAPLPAGEALCLILAHDDGRTPRLIGGVGIHCAGAEHEIGYWLTPAAWGRGYATEAGRAMLGIARYGLGHQRLVSGHFIDNPASGRVLRKLGFRATGHVERRDSRARQANAPCATYTLDFGEDACGAPRMAA